MGLVDSFFNSTKKQYFLTESVKEDFLFRFINENSQFSSFDRILPKYCELISPLTKEEA